MNKGAESKKIDWIISLVPLTAIVLLCLLFFVEPEASNIVLGNIRFVLGDSLGVYYLIIGLGVLLVSFYLAFCRASIRDVSICRKVTKKRHKFITPPNFL